MTSDQILAEISEANLTYLMLAGGMDADPKTISAAQARFRLGISEESDPILLAPELSPAQILRVASSNMLLCRLRTDDDTVWNRSGQNHQRRAKNRQRRHTAGLHAAFLMAGAASCTKPSRARSRLPAPDAIPFPEDHHVCHKRCSQRLPPS
jgi:flagellar transcriptional activator FlhD